jgi:hypothetical protein
MAHKHMTRKEKAKAGIANESCETLVALLHCKGRPMRDRRERRAKDARRSWKNEEF